jgi:tetratricopeptide (TPR) repeat protein
MENKLDFSLPEAKDKHSGGRGFLILLLAVVAALAAANLYVSTRSRPPGPAAAALMTADQTRHLAEKLAARGLYGRAARAWQDYLETGSLDNAERARALFQAGSLLEKAGDYDEAIECFYRSEAAANVRDLQPLIRTHVKDCFEKLGKFSALRYELMDRTGFGESTQAGTEIVAEIGAEKISAADLDAMIERSMENQLAQFSAFMTGEQINRQKERMLEQFAGSEARMQFLQSYLAQEILYRQGLAEKIADDPPVGRQIEEMARAVISRQVMNRRLADKVNVTETDIKNHYEANKANYAEPENADENIPERQKPFEEVREQVEMDLLAQKRQEVQAEYVRTLMDEHDVVIHTSAFEKTERNDN